MLVKFTFSVLVNGALWLGMSWVFSRAQWAALQSFPGGRDLLFFAQALAWFPWVVAMVASTVAREAIDPHDRMGIGATIGLAVLVAIIALGLSLLLIHLLPPTRRLYRDLREAARAARADAR